MWRPRRGGERRARIGHRSAPVAALRSCHHGTLPIRRRTDPTAELARFERATVGLDPPFALIDLEAFDANAGDLVRRARGKPVRVASKSVRCRTLLKRVLDTEGFQGVLAFTLPEALWLAEDGIDDIVVAYPSVNREALRHLAKAIAASDRRITIMVDGVAHLDLIDAAVGPGPTPIRVCIDIDAGLELLGGRVHIGAKRSPIHTPEHAADLARHIVGRTGFHLVGATSPSTCTKG